MIENSIELYPNLEKVFIDKSLGIYFRPLLTFSVKKNGSNYKIHLLGTDGLFCNKEFKYSENNFFGFKYKNGLYDFLGDLKVFENYKLIPKLYNFLINDFLENRDDYIKNKIKTDDYLKGIKTRYIEIERKKFDDIKYYAEAFYSYEFTKYYYEKYGIHKHISVITENYGKNEDSFLISDAESILEEFFINMEYNLTNDYKINPNMFVGATERSRFMSIIGGGDVIAMLNTEEDIVYMLEYNS